MIAWYGQGYFQGESIVFMREIKPAKSIYEDEEEVPWVKSDTIDFAKLGQ